MQLLQVLQPKGDLIEQSGSKAELVTMARAKGWSGDPERFALPLFNEATQEIVQVLGKKAIAYWLAACADEKEAASAVDEALKAALGDKKFGGVPEARAIVDDEPTNEGEASGMKKLSETEQKIKAKQQGAEKAEKSPATEFGSVVAKMVQAMLDDAENKKSQLDMDVEQEIEKQPSRKIEISSAPALPPVSIEGTHPIFEKVLRLVNAGVNVLLIGETGVGKTHLAEAIAKALSLEYSAIHCTAGASESHLMGWLLPTGEGGRFEYKPAPFVKLYEQGNSLFLFDEMDAADPNFLLSANGALANGHVHVPMNLDKPTIKRGDNQKIMATANTFGNGADLIYAGRNQLDGATLDRWYMVRITYQEALEAEIMGIKPPKFTPWRPTELMDETTVKSDNEILHKWLVNLRKKSTDNKLRRIVSTRSFQKAVSARSVGIPIDEIKADLLQGWTQDELRKVGELK